MEKGIPILKLVDSDASIFRITFDYDDWPGTHTDEAFELRPYNKSFFHLRYFYKEVFPEEQFESIDGKDI